MNHYRLIAIGTIFIFAAAARAQQTPASRPAPAKVVSAPDDAALPSVEAQLKVLTEKLNLSDDQQTTIRPILKNLHDVTEKVAQNKSLSHEERLAKVRPQRIKADQQIRQFLSDDQKKKLDQYLAGPHGEMHGNLTGSPPATAPPQH